MLPHQEEAHVTVTGLEWSKHSVRRLLLLRVSALLLCALATVPSGHLLKKLRAVELWGRERKGVAALWNELGILRPQEVQWQA